MWPALSGVVLSLGLAMAAWLRSRARTRTYYEDEIYGMTPGAYRRYALFFAAMGALFAAGLVLTSIFVEELAGTVLAIGAILYGATFLRGASGEDE